MKDRYVVYEDGRRVNVSDLSEAEIRETLDMLNKLEPMDGTDCTHAEMRERLNIELTKRAFAAQG